MKFKFIIGFVLTSLFSSAQSEVTLFPSPSPKGTISQIIGNTKIEIEYERPLARKRKIFGDLVPWNQLWRTGAGASTKIRINQPVVIEGQKVAAGYYSLFTIPNFKSWMVIINADTTSYGIYGYDKAKDITRFVVTPQTTARYYEALTIDLDLLQSNARLFISWTNVQINFNIITTTATDAMKFIEENLLTGKNKQSDVYFEAAQFLFFERTHLPEALKLADKAIELNKDNGGARRVKVEIYEYLALYKAALREISHALEMEKNKKYEKEQDRTAEITYWQTLQKRIINLQKKR